MENFNFKVLLQNEEVANTQIRARSEADANIIVRQQYPPAKGYTYELINE